MWKGRRRSRANQDRADPGLLRPIKKNQIGKLTLDSTTLFWHKVGDYVVYKPTLIRHKAPTNGARYHVGSFLSLLPR